jgi:hypothetical protein
MSVTSITGNFAQKITNTTTSIKLTQVRAREIMGWNFFGIEEAIKHFGVNPSTQELAYLADMPFSEETLTACRYSHILIAVFPLSILEIRGKVDSKVFYCPHFRTHEMAWYNREAFAKDCGEIGWHLVRRSAVPHSTRKTWWQQQRLLSMKDEKTPAARVLVYTMAGHFLSTRERLFIYYPCDVRCSDHVSNSYVVVSGYDDMHPEGAFGICLHTVYASYEQSPTLGIASERNAEH